MASTGLCRLRFRYGLGHCYLVPHDQRRAAWKALQQAMNLDLPKLMKPAWLETPLWVLGMTGSGAAAVAWIYGYPALSGLAALIVLICFLVLQLIKPLATIVPSSVSTIGSMVYSVIGLNSVDLGIQQKSWTERNTWDVLVEVIRTQLGVPREQIRPNSRFVEDLGC